MVREMRSGSLDELFSSLEIDKNEWAGITDAYLKADWIEKAFDKHQTRVKKLIKGYLRDEDLADNVLDLFEKLIQLIRVPYIEEITRLKEDHTRVNAELAHATEQQHIDLARATEQHHLELARATEQHHLELARVTEQNRIDLARATDQHNATMDRSNQQILEVMAAKDGQLTAMRSESVALNKRLQDTIERHAVEMRELKTFHHRRVLLDTGKVNDKMIEGSVGMTEVWKKVQSSPNFIDNVALADVPTASRIEISQLPQFPPDLKVESKMYPPIFECLSGAFNAPKSDVVQGAKTWKTDRSNINGYSGRKPDLIVTVDVAIADLSSIIAPWEVKVKRPSNKDFGQLYGYIHALTAKQRARRKFVGVLQCLEFCYVLILERRGPELWVYKKSNPMMLQDVISWFHYHVLSGADFSPHFPKFSADLGELVERLGDPAFCAVGIFPLPGPFTNTFPLGTTTQSAFGEGRWVNQNLNSKNVDSENKCVVVKRILPYVDADNLERPVKDEIEILIRIEALRNEERQKRAHHVDGQRYLPDLLFYSLDFQEFGIIPVGTPLHPEQQRRDWPNILCNILSALEWLHAHDIVHRDVRWSNVVHYVDHAVLVDFGEAVDIRPGIFGDPKDDGLDADQAHRMLRREVYAGGLLCCPPRLLGLLHKKYTPQPSDDLHAFVLMANMLVWPKLWTRVSPKDVLNRNSRLTEQLKRFWKEMAANRIWKPYVAAAVARKYRTLEAIGTELCLFLGSGDVDPISQVEPEVKSEAGSKIVWSTIGSDEEVSSDEEEEVSSEDEK